MNLCVFLLSLIVNLKVVSCVTTDGSNMKQLWVFFKRRQGTNEASVENPADTLNYINDIQNLPEEEPIKPGHTLIRPSEGLLKSAAKYPQDLKNLVYGNLKNLGITYGDTQERLKYSGLRKGNDMLRRKSTNEAMVEDPADKLNYINDIQNLPEEEPIKPGHTLIRPSEGMLKSAAKYPQDLKTLVYGNLKNLGITYGDTHERLKYSGFRKGNNVLNELYKSIVTNNRYPDVIVLKPELERRSVNDYDSPEFAKVEPDFRRHKKSKSKSKYRNREKNYIGTSTENEREDETREYERNPGNPYTIHKNRYKVNYMWNHEMTGDHMNLNPFAPSIHNLGPTGVDLLFNRKWWYFNQDDYRPF